MHLKSYPKLVHSELRLDPVQMTSQRSSLFVGHHGNISSGRLPLSVISTNTLRCCNNTNNNLKGRMKLLPSPPPPGRENEALVLYQTTVTETADAPLDIWTVIRPGNVREKIAIFASDGAACSEHSDASSSRMMPSSTNHAPMTGPTRATKAKGSWEENGNPKRRRRSGSNQNHHQQHANIPPHHLELPQPEEAEPEDDPKVSVVEMVAFLEQRATEQQMDIKPLLTIQRSSASITLSKALPPETRGEEPESVRVLDMVARLESECLRRRAEGELSRSSSLRRTVGRVLLAAAVTAACQQSHASCPPSSGEPITCSEKTETLPSLDDTDCEGRSQKVEVVEPVPGLLFLSPSLHSDSAPLSPLDTPTDSETVPPLLFSSDSSSQSEKQKQNHGSDVPSSCSSMAVVTPVSHRPSASQDFLLMRQRLQQLLEPQPYLAILPHHLLVSIFVLLPTQSLAALKCTCHYFKFIIENYGVRPADSLWVSDPRYRDDPCKQCKKRYGRGDVSLCRWHHKPYCQALPYGPGYWMCCHGAHRDTPGCNVGLHDNHWVPAFHSINVPIYRGRRDADGN